MLHSARTAVLELAQKGRLFDLYAIGRRLITNADTTVLMYHRVGANPDSWSYPSLPVESFEAHVAYLSKHYLLWSLDRVTAFLAAGEPLPERVVAITFDDGYKDNLEVALPILRRHNVPAHVFVTTGYIDSDRLFWWDELAFMFSHTSKTSISLPNGPDLPLDSAPRRSSSLRAAREFVKRLSTCERDDLLEYLATALRVRPSPEDARRLVLSWDDVRVLAQNGISLGAHTITHPVLPHISLSAAQDEVTRSRDTLEHHLNCPITTFAYPNGDTTPAVTKIVKESGISAAYAINPQGPLCTDDDLHALPRVAAKPGLGRLALELSGLRSDLRKALRNSESKTADATAA